MAPELDGAGRGPQIPFLQLSPQMYCPLIDYKDPHVYLWARENSHFTDMEAEAHLTSSPLS